MGPLEERRLTAHFGWKGDRPGVRLESRSGEPVRSPKIISGDKRLSRLIYYIHHTCEYKLILSMWETLQNNADWDCFKTPILQETLHFRKPYVCSNQLDV